MLPLVSVPARPLPAESSPVVQHVYERFLFLLGCRWNYTPDAPVPFARDFAAALCQISEREARAAIDELIEIEALSPAGKHGPRTRLALALGRLFRVDARGRSMNLCSSCGKDFASVEAFDGHRVGNHSYTQAEGFLLRPPRTDGRRCRTGEGLIARGWSRDRRGRWVHARELRKRHSRAGDSPVKPGQRVRAPSPSKNPDGRLHGEVTASRAGAVTRINEPAPIEGAGGSCMSGITIALAAGLELTLPGDTSPAALKEYIAALAEGTTLREAPHATGSPFLTAAEAAEYLRFPLKRIYNLTSRREIPHRKQEGRLLFRTDELDRWMDRSTQARRAGPEANRTYDRSVHVNAPAAARTAPGPAPGG